MTTDPLLRLRPEFPILDVCDAGVAAIREKSLWQTGRLIEPGRRGGTAAVDFDHALEVSRELNARGVVVDDRPGVGIRMSPHFSTTDAELETAFEVIDEIRSSSARERWRGRPVLVT
jgi:kynureninase